ncbi:hypothetical protein BST81_05520 [Leptolyngbya sp. 'hensonii']|uniref:DUF6391 domain-containing protein n=1 Tax=Leptolyngbya sp. 'hensonii' TaxID=1922337 RepID=UPI00094FB046|nr:DUF6391 domain-containing protein [Leptolyngbya sp. 'hensonii']OLP19226.1 hypothetical protein BST81_05520 [Leptolyngbya sp. 'hensonii']
MVDSATPFWDIGELFSDALRIDLVAPQPRQDSDLLQQVGFLPGLKELLMLRQVHALEHATVWVLSELAEAARRNEANSAPQNDTSIGGISTERGFYLYGPVETARLSWAVRRALNRITSGEWNLAIHPRCGTNLSVGMMLTAGFALGFHLLLPRGPIEQLIGLGLATTTAAQLTPGFGRLTQQYLTTAIPFNLAVESVTPLPENLAFLPQVGIPAERADHAPVHFVQVRWVE